MSEKLTINGIDFEVDGYNVNELLHTLEESTFIRPERKEDKLVARGWFFDGTELTVLVRGRKIPGMVSQFTEKDGELIDFELTVFSYMENELKRKLE